MVQPNRLSSALPAIPKMAAGRGCVTLSNQSPGDALRRALRTCRVYRHGDNGPRTTQLTTPPSVRARHPGSKHPTVRGTQRRQDLARRSRKPRGHPVRARRFGFTDRCSETRRGRGWDADPRPVAQTSKSAVSPASKPAGRMNLLPRSNFRVPRRLRALFRFGNLRHSRLGGLRYAKVILHRCWIRPRVVTRRCGCDRVLGPTSRQADVDPLTKLAA